MDHHNTPCHDKKILKENDSLNENKLKKFSKYKNWKISDYDYNTSFKINNFANKNYFYNSDLAKKGTLYNYPNRKSDYLPKYFVRKGDTKYNLVSKKSLSRKLRNGKSNESRKVSNKEEGSVPGPFPYTWPWKQWGGDKKYNLGDHFTDAIIGHFGHTHIMTLHSKMNALRANPNANVYAQNKMLAHLLYASSQIFRKFAGLIDNNANEIKYDPSTPSGQLKMMMEMMIIGKNTNIKDCKCPTCEKTDRRCLSGITCCCNSGIIDTNMIIEKLTDLAENLALNDKNKKELMEYVEKLNKFLNHLLLLNDKNKAIHLMAWYQLLNMHQKDMFEAYILYKNYYEHPTEENKEKLNASVLMAINGGRQLGAFFGTFYGIIAFIDLLIQQYKESKNNNHEIDTAIDKEYRKERVDFIYYSETRWWMEHVTMFDDYAKALARNDDENVFVISVNMLESCTVVGITVGEIFRAFDKLVRKLNLYEVFDEIAFSMNKNKK